MLVSAPAGFGKTTLVGDWLAARESATAWLSLDSRDSDPGVFWSYVVAALRTAVPQVGDSAMSLLTDTPPVLTAVVTALLNDFAALDVEVVLVLDDYHVIESPEIHDSVAFMVDHLPPQLRLVMVSRADPPLPLARLRARADLLEIRAADLRFTHDEASAYFGEAMGLELTAGDVDALEARTEGWIAALQLAALSMRDRDDIGGFIANFAGDDRFVVDYLAEEVLERQPDEIRTFLLRTSVLDRLTGSLCDAVTATTGGRGTLELLERANLFLVPLDDQRRWYRYHHLFADVLQARLLDEQPEILDELHRRASDWYDAHGELSEAIEHALTGHDAERAARLIELAGAVMRRTRQERTFRRWLEALPGDVFENRPVLCLGLVGARMSTGDTTGVEPLLAEAERWVDARGVDTAATPIVFDLDEYTNLPAQTAVYRAGFALLTGDIASTIAHAERALELSAPDDHFRRGAASALTGLANWALGDLDRARDGYVAAIEHFRDIGFVSDLLGCSLALADIQLAQGRPREAQRTFESALKHASEHNVLRGTADMHVGMSELLTERNELDESERHLQITAELGDHAGLPQNAYRQRVAAALLAFARGDPGTAIDLLDDALPLFDTDFSPAARPVAAIKARVQLASGDIAGAERWARSVGLGIDDEPTYVREYEHITLARTMLARRSTEHSSLDATMVLLRRLLAAAEAGSRGGAVIEVLVLLAAAHQAAGDRSQATAALERALTLAAPEGRVRVFLDVTPSLAPLIDSVTLQGVAGEHLAHIRGSVSDTRSESRTGPAGALSARELEVLRLLRSDLSGPDLARELHVSLNTLRTHTKNIFTKLGVTNRREAVRRAAELGL